MADKPPRFITPEGFARIRTEYDELFGSERPKLGTAVMRKRPSSALPLRTLRRAASAASCTPRA